MSETFGSNGSGPTARDVVAGAMRDMGLIGLADAPEPEELQYGIDQLDLMLKSLAAEGLVPWADEESQVTFAAGENEAVLTPRPVEVSEASLVMSATYQRKLYRWGAGEYGNIPNKTQRGDPVRFDLRFTPMDVRMRLWPVPNKGVTIAYTYVREIEKVAANTSLDVPVIWGDAIRKMLKARLLAFKPDGVPQYVMMEAEIAKQKLLDFGRPESYVLGPMY